MVWTKVIYIATSQNLTTHDVVQFNVLKLRHMFLELEAGPMTQKDGLWRRGGGKEEGRDLIMTMTGEVMSLQQSGERQQPIDRRPVRRLATLILVILLSKPWSPKNPQRDLSFSGIFLKHTHTNKEVFFFFFWNSSVSRHDREMFAWCLHGYLAMCHFLSISRWTSSILRLKA